MEDGMPVLDPGLECGDAPPHEADPSHEARPGGADEDFEEAASWPEAGAHDGSGSIADAASSEISSSPAMTWNADEEPYASGPGWEPPEASGASVEHDFSDGSALLAGDDAPVDVQAEWTAGEPPMDEDAGAAMLDDEPPPLLLEDVVDAHLPPESPDGPGIPPGLAMEPEAESMAEPAPPCDAMFGQEDGPAPAPRPITDAPPARPGALRLRRRRPGHRRHPDQGRPADLFPGPHWRPRSRAASQGIGNGLPRARIHGYGRTGGGRAWPEHGRR